MTNPYFNNTRTYLPGTKADGADVDDDFDAVAVGFDGVDTAVKRAIKLNTSETDDQVITENATSRVNKVVGFDSSGNLVLHDQYTTIVTSRLGVINRGDYSGDTGPLVNLIYDWGNGQSLSNPGTLPTGATSGLSWSPSGEYLAVTHDVSPYVTIYQRQGTTLTKLANPGTLPTGIGQDATWSLTGEFLAIGHTTSPYITIYQRSGNTFTKLSNPASLPAGDAKRVAFSPNGRFLAVTHGTSPYVTIYERDGTTFTKLADPGTLPTGTGLSVDFSPNGEYMAVGHTSDPHITVYKISGTTFTKLTDPSEIPAERLTDIKFSPNGAYVAGSIGLGSTTTFAVYSLASDVLTKLSDPASIATAASGALAWNPDGRGLIVGDSVGTLYMYTVSGTTISDFSNPIGTDPTSTITGLEWTNNGEFLAACTGSTPYISVYQTNLSLSSDGYLQIDAPWKEGT